MAIAMALNDTRATANVNAHGHRSRLSIWQSGTRQPELEARWAHWLDNRYLLEQADIEHQDDVS